MKVPTWVLAGVVYASVVLVNSGFVYAYFVEYHKVCDALEQRKEAGFALLWSSVPVIPWVVTPFVTGFYYYGWKMPGTEWSGARRSCA